MRWDVVARWRARTPTHGGQPAYPYAFASNDAAFPQLAGKVLWLVSSPRYGGYRQAPSIVARLSVTAVVESKSPRALSIDPEVLRHGNWVALAKHDRYAYLPLNGAYEVLHRLRFKGRTPRLPVPEPGLAETPGGPYADIPGRFQRHRILAPDSAELLEEYAKAVWNGRRVFLSYRRQDFEGQSHWVPQLADSLTSAGVACWWDRGHIPLAATARTHLLGGILDDAVRQAAWFVALMRPRYLADRTSEWVSREWGHADLERSRPGRRHRMERVAVVLGEPSGLTSWVDPAKNTDHVLTLAADATPQQVTECLLPLISGVER